MRLKHTSTSPVTPSDESTDIFTDTEELNAKSYTTLKSIDQEEIRTDQWPLILLFKDTQLEKEFADYYYVKYADRWWKRFLQLRLSLFFLTFGMSVSFVNNEEVPLLTFLCLPQCTLLMCIGT